jgi:hypothetical protein
MDRESQAVKLCNLSALSIGTASISTPQQLALLDLCCGRCVRLDEEPRNSLVGPEAAPGWFLLSSRQEMSRESENASCRSFE